MKLFKSLQFVLFLLPILAYADTAKTTETTASTGLLQILSALIFVIFLLLFAAWALKRISPSINNHKVSVKVVGGTSIGHREKIMVIEVANQWIVVGVTANQINTLSTMEKIDMTPENITTTPTTSFAHWLKKTIDQRRKAST
jgi:flagellar protein FliO/FliZ